MSAKNPPPNRNRRKVLGHTRQGQRRSQGQGHTTRQDKQCSPRHSDHHSKRKKIQRRRRHHRSSEEKFLREYEHFTRNHQEARNRYFEQYYRGDDRRRRKLELTFFKTVEKLRDFEAQITDKQWVLIKHPAYANDATYSTNHQLTGPEATCKEWTDSMMSPTQLNRKSFRHDRETSMGTMEDYQKYQQEKSK